MREVEAIVLITKSLNNNLSCEGSFNSIEHRQSDSGKLLSMNALCKPSIIMQRHKLQPAAGPKMRKDDRKIKKKWTFELELSVYNVVC